MSKAPNSLIDPLFEALFFRQLPAQEGAWADAGANGQAVPDQTLQDTAGITPFRPTDRQATIKAFKAAAAENNFLLTYAANKGSDVLSLEVRMRSHRQADLVSSVARDLQMRYRPRNRAICAQMSRAMLNSELEGPIVRDIYAAGAAHLNSDFQ